MATTIQQFLDEKELTLESFTREHERGLYRWLLDGSSDASPTLPEGLDAECRVTQAAGLTLPGIRSRSTFKKRVSAGVILPVETGPRRWLVGDLYAPEADMFKQATRRRGGRRVEEGRSPLQRSTVLNYHSVLKNIVKYAGEVMRIQLDPRLGTVEVPNAATGTGSEKQNALTLEDAVRIARHLHAVHQTIFWVMRILGFRSGEAYGLHVGDLEFQGAGGFGLVLLLRQGVSCKRRGGRRQHHLQP